MFNQPNIQVFRILRQDTFVEAFAFYSLCKMGRYPKEDEEALNTESTVQRREGVQNFIFSPDIQFE